MNCIFSTMFILVFTWIVLLLSAIFSIAITGNPVNTWADWTLTKATSVIAVLLSITLMILVCNATWVLGVGLLEVMYDSTK